MIDADKVAIDAHIAELAASADDTESMLGEELKELARLDADAARSVHEIVYNITDGHDPEYNCAQIVNACLRAARKAVGVERQRCAQIAEHERQRWEVKYTESLDGEMACENITAAILDGDDPKP